MDNSFGLLIFSVLSLLLSLMIYNSVSGIVFTVIGLGLEVIFIFINYQKGCNDIGGIA